MFQILTLSVRGRGSSGRREGRSLLPPAVWLVLTALGLLAAMSWAEAAAQESAGKTALERYLQKVPPQALFPQADRFGPLEGAPPVLPAYRGSEKVGYVFLNSDFAASAGYSGKPIQILLAIDRDGVIQGARLVDHHEPIVLVGIPERKIAAVIEGYVGLDIVTLARKGTSDRALDIVSGATVTIMVIDDSILTAALKVARLYGLGGLEERQKNTGPRMIIDPDRVARLSWPALLGEGAVRRLHVTVAEVNRDFEALGDEEAARRPERGDPEADFVDLYAGLATIPSVGRSLLGEAEYQNLLDRLQSGQAAIVLAGRGRFSFKGSGYVRGGIFDRFQIVQGDATIRFRDRDHRRLKRIAAAGAPDFKDVDLFIVPETYAFDPAAPWRLELLVSRATGPTRKAYLMYDLTYVPPEKYLKPAVPADAAVAAAPSGEAPAAGTAMADGNGRLALWQKIWLQKKWEVVVLSLSLALLTLIFFFQDWLVKRRQLTERVRIGFLLFTVFGIGFYGNAQLSVVNVVTFFNALATDFNWDYFLMEPLIFILWSSVAISLLFWGRGAFCGWLCPFGALQELLNKAAKALRIPQYTVPWGLHERLWPIKYIIFLVLFGVSLHSLSLAERLAEVEPFKTAIILKFMRAWPFVLYAAALLVAGLFIERFYCRYLCPLGAALGIPGRMRMFDWLKRYRECGSPCQRCKNECMVQAIHPEGQINPNECLYCLHCQTLYHDDQRCPVMIQRRLKRERRHALSTPAVTTQKHGERKPKVRQPAGSV